MVNLEPGWISTFVRNVEVTKLYRFCENIPPAEERDSLGEAKDYTEDTEVDQR